MSDRSPSRLALLGLVLLCACEVRDVAAVQQSDGGTCARTVTFTPVGDVPCSTGRSAQWRFALCSCESAVVSAPLTTEITRTGSSPFGAGVGGVGRLDVAAPLSIAGSWINASTQSLVGTTPVQLTIAGDLLHAGAIEGSLDIDVGGDLMLGGALQAHDVAVGGTLRTPSDAPITISGRDEAPRRNNDVQAIDVPCACDSASQHAIADWITALGDDHDNAQHDLDLDALSNVQTATTLTLDCGRYRLRGVGAAEALTLRVNGDVALYVDGELALARDLVVDVRDGALDLIVGGNVTIGGALITRGEAEAWRMLVGGNGTVNLGGASTLGTLYAPQAELVTQDSLHAWGSIFVRRLGAHAAITVHYDARRFDPTTPLCE